ncbi:hypothetical protein NEA10_06645 [Phormidium yuhuli AB48]|uniref:Uncharacterized protein n=1 Tax=Phormidium yuhuli AB48 TaxID=2940671 RepID=A0ABY5AVZ0_9CYAN|nr:hypothetical protein [Phormidium yuhuli]USR92394.1 hypothetical protein NEA10_06645 [Phormidium yuhuli AB48]
MDTHLHQPNPQREAVEKKSMDEMLLTLDHLFEREEATAKIVLAALYDMGAENIYYRQLRSRILRGAFRPVTKISKPVFLFFGLRWFKANCPFLIADWLRSLVEFEKQMKANESEVMPVEATSLSNNGQPREKVVFVERGHQEIERLSGQVQLLTSTLLITVAVMGGMLAWLGYELHLTRANLQQEPAMTQTRSEGGRN